VIEPIQVPDATREPAAYVRALVDTLGDREPLEVLRQTPTTPGYDEKRWSLLPRPAPTQVMAALEGLRAVNLAVLDQVDDDGGRRLGVHGEQGEELFDLTVRKVAGHDLAHLNQLARTVAAVRTHG
jgi:hypothetical protein